MNAGRWRGHVWLGQAARLLAFSSLVASACDDREVRVPQRDRDPGSGAAPRGGASDEPTPESAGASSTSGGATSGGAEATAGAAGDSGDQSCDAACLDSVVSQTSDFGMKWKDSWFLVGCKEVAGRDCLNVKACSNLDPADFEQKGIWTLETFPIGGVPGKHYKVTFTFNANASGKEYRGGSRDQGSAVSASAYVEPSDTFYRDGEPIPSSYDPWKLSVFDEAGVELRHYYMNSFPPLQRAESHRTFLISFTKSIVVVGGGQITHRVQDPNCRVVDNCPREADDYCPPGYLPNEPMSLMPPAMYQDPQDGIVKPTSELTLPGSPAGQPWHSQIGHLTVIGVEETDDPITKDYL